MLGWEGKRSKHAISSIPEHTLQHGNHTGSTINTPTSVVATILTSSAFAITQYTVASDPVYLVLLSNSTQYNGATLASCHEEAALEGLCLGGSLNASIGQSYRMFKFNTSVYSYVQDPSLGESGILTWTLPAGSFNRSLTCCLPWR